MVPDFIPSYDPAKNELVGALCLSDAIEIITKYCDRKTGTPVSLSRVVTSPGGDTRKLLMTNQQPDGVSTPLSGFHTLTPLRTGDSVEIAMGADPLPKPSPTGSRRRVVLLSPTRNR